MSATQPLTDRADKLLRESCSINMYDQNAVAEVIVNTIYLVRDLAALVEGPDAATAAQRALDMRGMANDIGGTSWDGGEG